MSILQVLLKIRQKLGGGECFGSYSRFSDPEEMTLTTSFAKERYQKVRCKNSDKDSNV